MSTSISTVQHINLSTHINADTITAVRPSHPANTHLLVQIGEFVPHNNVNANHAICSAAQQFSLRVGTDNLYAARRGLAASDDKVRASGVVKRCGLYRGGFGQW